MAFQINGTTVITDARHLNNIVDADEGSAQALQDALPTPLYVAFVPNNNNIVNNPSATIQGGSTTVSGTWSKPSGMVDSEAILVMMTEQGGAGNYNPYQSNWGFAGIGGRTSLIFTSAGDLNGSTYSIPPNAAWSTWQGQASTVEVTFTINGTSYSTASENATLVWTNSNNIAATSSNANNYLVNNSGILLAANSFTRTSYGGTNSGVTSPAVDFAGGHGQGNYSTYGQAQVSNISGNGGNLSQAGYAPGGGGGGNPSTTQNANRGGYGSIRLWYASDTVGS